MSDEELGAIVGCFVKVRRKGGLKVNEGKSKVMVLNGEKELECEVHLISLEHMSKFKYLGSVLDESGTGEGESHRKVASGRRAAGVIRSLVNARGLQLECARALHEILLEPVHIYDTET